MAKKATVATTKPPYGKVRCKYRQSTVKKRLEALFLDNVGRILSREQILQAAKDPKTGAEPENWHQRLSELRTDDGYTILSWRNRGDLKVQEYLMPHTKKRRQAARRVRPSDVAWIAVLKRADYCCEWSEAAEICGLKEGEIDPVGGGRVKLTPDHRRPHAINPKVARNDPNEWQALCGRHQVVKKHYWDNLTGKLNTYAVVQAAPSQEKKMVFRFLLEYFGYEMSKAGNIRRKIAK